MAEHTEHEKKMTLEAHLAELRARLILSLSVVFVATLISYIYSEKLYNLIYKPIKSLSITLIFTSPIEGFIVTLLLALLSGLILSAPFIIYQIVMFVLPALNNREKKIILLLLPGFIIMFLIGVLVGYFIILPICLKFLIRFGPGFVKPIYSVQKYTNFLFSVVLIFGLVFEFPLITIIFLKLGILKRTHLTEKRKYIYFSTFLFSALFTPPDVISMLLMAVPLVFLYEITVFLALFIKKSKKEDEEDYIKESNDSLSG